MADPEEALKGLPPESPPPEIVLAAVRVFRYRALAIVALALALVLCGVLVSKRIGVESQFSVQVAIARGTGSSVVAGDVRTVDGFNVVVWDIVGNGKTLYVHLVGWDPQRRKVWVEMADPRFGGVPAQVTGGESNSNSDGNTTLFDEWVGLTTPESRGQPFLPPLTFDAQIVTYGNQGTRQVLASVPFQVDH
jgi:hypothetical protein